jgi:hypothetical protein
MLKYIKNTGCLPFYMYNNSDHRGMFIDVSEELIDDKVELQKPTKRHIGTNSSGYDIFNYKKYIDNQFKIHRIYDKTNILVSSAIPINELEAKLNKIDTIITDIMLNAEKKYCQPRHDNNWSVELHTQSTLCNYWLKTYKGIKNNIQVDATIQRLYLSLPETLQQDIDQLLTHKSRSSLLRLSIQQICKNIKYKKELIKNHQEIRRSSLNNLKDCQKAKRKKQI